jgi:hypothetical protein
MVPGESVPRLVKLCKAEPPGNNLSGLGAISPDGYDKTGPGNFNYKP